MRSLADWLLVQARRPDPPGAFDLVDLAERGSRTDEIETWMAGRLLEERFSPGLLQDLVGALGWEEAAEAVRSGMPSASTLRKGYFGEVLAAEHLQHFDGYHVPVRKLRYMVASGQSLPGVDVFGVRLGSENDVVAACYMEAKVRTGTDPAAAVLSVKQLADGVSKSVPDILLFVAARLEERGDPLYDAFLAYMHDRAQTARLDEYRSFLTWEQRHWSDRVIENLFEHLAESGSHLTPLTVLVTRIDDLDSMIEHCYQLAGLAVDPHDD